MNQKINKVKNNSIIFFFLLWTYMLSGQSVIDPDNIVVGANQMPTSSSSDSVFYFDKGTMSWRAGLFENGIAAPSITRKWSGAWGRNNNIDGDFSTGWGNVNTTEALHGTVWGESNTVTGNFGVAWGKNNQVSGFHGAAWGANNVSDASYGTMWGESNLMIGSHLTVWGERNGSLGEYNTVWGFENNATDTLSTIWGKRNVASGTGSTVWGIENKATDRLSTAWGTETQANGDLTTAWGIANRADSIGATVWGSLNRSLNFYATAWGRANSALGVHSTVAGEGNGTHSKNATVVGQFNLFYDGPIFDVPPSDLEIIVYDNYGNQFFADDFHQLFVVGNGTDVNNKSNAITVTKSGRLGIGVDLPASLIHIPQDEEIRLGNRATLSGNDLVIETNATIRPEVNNGAALGSSIHRWDRVYATGGVVSTSDIRLKENINPVVGAMDKIEKLTPIYYNLISHPEERVIGFSAQQLELVIPEVVHKEKYLKEDGGFDYTYGVNYAEIIPLLTKGIQEQQQMIDQSKFENDHLESELEIIKKNIAELQAILKSK